MDNIRYGFIHAYAVLSSVFAENRAPHRSMSSILDQVVKLPQEVVDFREWVETTYGPKCAAAAAASRTAGHADTPVCATPAPRGTPSANDDLSDAAKAVHEWANSKVRRLSSKLLDGDDVDVSEIMGFTPADGSAAPNRSHESATTHSQRPPSAQSRGQPAAAPIHNACKTSRKKKSKKDFSASAADSTMSTAMHGDHKRRRKWKKVAVAQHGRETTARSVSIVSNQESEATRSRRLRAERRAGGYKKAAKKAAKKRSSGKSSNKKTTAQRWANSNGAASTKNSWKKKKNAGSKQ
eukprot:m.911520 g.911520  ORF g.911520 m.911520 type:complete len:295 (-) comp23725_c0_seq4:1351-2235(-)